MIKKEAEKSLKYKDFTIAHAECKNKVDTSNNRRDWDHFKVIQKIREQHTRKHEVNEPQKTAILGTAHILQKVLT